MFGLAQEAPVNIHNGPCCTRTSELLQWRIRSFKTVTLVYLQNKQCESDSACSCELHVNPFNNLIKGLTCLPCRESEGHDVIHEVGIVWVRRVEGQGSTASAPQVQQEGGVHHGDRKAALPLPFTDGNVLRGPSVVALHTLGDPDRWLSCRFSDNIWHRSPKNLLPAGSGRTRSLSKGSLSPTWALRLSDSQLSCRTTLVGLSASCHCPQTTERETWVDDFVVNSLCLMVCYCLTHM